MPFPEPLNAPGAPPPPLFAGDPAPWFHAPCDLGGPFPLGAYGGRWSAVVFVEGLVTKDGARLARAIAADAQRFEGSEAALVFVSRAADDIAKPTRKTGIRVAFDESGAIAARWGVGDGAWSFILDPTLRIVAILSDLPPEAHAAELLRRLDSCPTSRAPSPAALQAPVLMIDRVFEPALCASLIAGHSEDGGHETGYMVDQDGRTVEVKNHDFKRRTDWIVSDGELQAACRARVQRRVTPEVQRAFQFEATRIERHLVARYDAETGGHFARHRDNTTRGTAHRRFAMSVNLNDDYDGGELTFPEFGSALFRPPAGGACVFSCSLLHQALPVRRGSRFVYVPFLFDETAAALRDALKRDAP